MADSAGYPGTPGWVKVFGSIALLLVLLFVIVHLTGRGLGNHTPGDRSPSDARGGLTPPDGGS